MNININQPILEYLVKWENKEEQLGLGFGYIIEIVAKPQQEKDNVIEIHYTVKVGACGLGDLYEAIQQDDGTFKLYDWNEELITKGSLNFIIETLAKLKEVL